MCCVAVAAGNLDLLHPPCERAFPTLQDCFELDVEPRSLHAKWYPAHSVDVVTSFYPAQPATSKNIPEKEKFKLCTLPTNCINTKLISLT